MTLSGSHQLGDSGHLADHNLIDAVIQGQGVDTRLYPRVAGEADDTNRLNRALTAAKAAGVPLLLSELSYDISATLDLRGDSLVVLGSSPLNTRVVQHTGNIPVVQMGGTLQRISGILFKYNTYQDHSNPNANVCELWHPNLCRYTHLRFQAGYRCLYLPQVDANGLGGNTVFSNFFDSIELYGYSENAIEFKSLGANSTGNHFSNIYTHNNWNGTADTAFSGAILMTDFDESVFNQLNVEYVSSQVDIVKFVRCGNMVLNSLHLEQAQLPGGASAAGAIRVSDNTHLSVNGFTYTHCTVAAGAGIQSLLRVGGASAGENNRVFIEGLRERNSTVSATTFSVVDFDTDATASTVEVRGLDASGVTALVTNDAKALCSRIGVISRVRTTAITGNYTVLQSDMSGVIEGTSGSAITLTVPNDTTADIPIGASVVVQQRGAGQIALAAGAGVTIEAPGAKIKTAAQYASATLRKRAANTWAWDGDVST